MKVPASLRMMHEHFQHLLTAYLTGRLTDNQRQELLSLLGNEELAGQLAGFIRQQLTTGDWHLTANLQHTEDRIIRGVLQKIQSQQPDRTREPAENSSASTILAVPLTPAPRMGIVRRWGWAAAIILLIAGAGTVAYLHIYTRPAPALVSNHQPTGIAPGGNKAILTLANGTTIILDSASTGAIAQQGQSSVIKSAGGQISYQPAGAAVNPNPGTTGNPAAAANPAMMNTLRTPRGGQYRLTLPDGTKVWLNAASTITYPTAFTGPQRKVTITGEAYFEVTPDPAHPFIATVDDRYTIQVLGTSFNVDGYMDAGTMNTTLLQGSVRVMADLGPGPHKNPDDLLKPGQQLRIGNKTATLIPNADIDKAMAWKNGFFDFDELDLKEAMHQIERWYDVQVIYEKGIPDIRFEGGISRNIQLADLLKVLARADVKFRIEPGRKLVVLP